MIDIGIRLSPTLLRTTGEGGGGVQMKRKCETAVPAAVGKQRISRDNDDGDVTPHERFDVKLEQSIDLTMKLMGY